MYIFVHCGVLLFEMTATYVMQICNCETINTCTCHCFSLWCSRCELHKILPPHGSWIIKALWNHEMQYFYRQMALQFSQTKPVWNKRRVVAALCTPLMSSPKWTKVAWDRLLDSHICLRWPHYYGFATFRCHSLTLSRDGQFCKQFITLRRQVDR